MPPPEDGGIISQFQSTPSCKRQILDDVYTEKGHKMVQLIEALRYQPEGLGSEQDIMYEIMESGPVQGTAQHMEVCITEITNILAYGCVFNVFL